MTDAAYDLLDPVAETMVAARRERAAAVPSRVSTVRSLNVALLVPAAIGFAVALPSARTLHIGTLVLLTLAYVLAGRVEFEVGTGFAVATEIVLVPMLFLLPAPIVPLTVFTALVLSQLPEVVRRRTSVATLAAAGGSGWFAFGPAAVMLAAGEPAPAAHRWPLLVALLGAQFAADFVSTSAVERAALSIRPAAIVDQMRTVFTVDLFLAPIGFLAAIVGAASGLALLMPLPLLLLVHRFARERTVRVDGALELSQAYRGTALLLGDVIEADDAYTGSHSRDVVSLTLAVADELGLSARDRRDAEFAALLHDVGKIRIPDEILNKPGPLTTEERAVIETHTIEGQRMLEQVGGLLGRVGRIVRSCHERWDGAGYPDGLAGEEIPLAARIICACDAFNAMTTDRPYRRALAHAVAVAEIAEGAGGQFDPEVAAALLRVVAV
ncbi:MAG TPA: HD-GYP domain-containing protein [Gaiellaceae bacterium]|nr:HD-GYP domain-containing protein [Gaiellaceae bacterium]